MLHQPHHLSPVPGSLPSRPPSKRSSATRFRLTLARMQHGLRRLGRQIYHWRVRRSPSGARLNDYGAREEGGIEPRHVITFLLFLAMFVAYTERVGFSLAYTAMAAEAAVDESLKGTLLSAFYWGYGLSQIPAGWAAQRIGGGIVLSSSFVLWSTAGLLTPGDAHRSGAMIVARVLVGVAQGLMIPATHTLLAKWIPPHEKAAAVSFALSGMYLGASFSIFCLPSVMSLLGPLALLKLTAGAGVSWAAAWWVLGSEAPARGAIIPISRSEGRLRDAPIRAARSSKAVPWGAMLSHPAVWAIVLNNFTFHYGIYVVMQWLPTYFRDFLKADLTDVGALKAVPYLAVFLFSNVGGWLGDHLIRRRRFSTAAGRKAVNTLGFWGAAVCFMLMPMATGVSSGIFFTSLSLACLGLSRGGFSVNHMDIAPKYAGAIMGISNTAGTLAGVIGVRLTGVMLEAAGGASETRGWYNVFASISLLSVSGSFIFAACARGVQIFSD